LPDGTALRGRALRIAADGRLVVAEIASGVEHEVSAGDVVHVR
jgi:BirA family biotin operon repressor/biotin-[acetyl-CoA-carboxylase] ligase